MPKKKSTKARSKTKTKTVGSISVKSLCGNVSCIQVQGNREYQEDSYIVDNISDTMCLLVCFDGHGGDKCSKFCAQKFLSILKDRCKSATTSKQTEICIKKSIRALIDMWDRESIGVNNFVQTYNSQVKKEDFFKTKQVKVEDMSGTTVSGLVINTNAHQMHVFNLGDSRTCIMKKNNQIVSTCDKSITQFTRPPKSRYRTWISDDLRLQGDLAMMSSIGDNTVDLIGVVSRDVECFSTSYSPNKTSVVVATDGFWDVFDYQQAMSHMKDIPDMMKDVKSFEDNTTVLFATF